LTKINKSLIVPNAPLALNVKVEAKLAVSPPDILFSQISQIQVVDLGPPVKKGSIKELELWGHGVKGTG
jgi:hypothetical protein